MYTQLGLLFPYLGVQTQGELPKDVLPPRVVICPADAFGRQGPKEPSLGDWLHTSYWINWDACSYMGHDGPVSNQPSNRAITNDYFYWWQPCVWDENIWEGNHNREGTTVLRLDGSVIWVSANLTRGRYPYDYSIFEKF